MSATPNRAKSPSRSTKQARSVAFNDPPETASPTVDQQPITATDQYKTAFQIIAGSYEKILYGILVSVGQPGDAPKLVPVFSFPAHVSCIKAVAASPRGAKWLASGSTDEIIKIWDLRRRKEVGGLQQHQGSISFLEFPSRSHLLTASEDGTICLFHARDWTLLRSFRGHKGAVNCVAIHPSGKAALSVGKDRMLRMWDMMRGKGSASIKLGKEGEIVRWSTIGDLFAVQSGSTIDLYSTDMTLQHTITHPSRLHDIKFCRPSGFESDLLLACAEDKKVTIYAIGAPNPPVIAFLVGHQNRVKAVDTLSLASGITYAATVSSDGNIHVYDLGELTPGASPNTEPRSMEPIGTYDTKGTRLTCITIAEGEVPVAYPVIGKRKRGGQDEEDELPEPRRVLDGPKMDEDGDDSSSDT